MQTEREAAEQEFWDEEGDQINVPPQRNGALWKVVVSSIRCPNCNSTEGKKLTGKRLNAKGLQEYYRCCLDCNLRFRVILE